MSLVTWTEKKDGENITYTSGPKTEYIIFKEKYFWVLAYPDFWTTFNDPHSRHSAFIINVKRYETDPFAVESLKAYAEAVHKIYLEHQKFLNWE
jgi:hypothetical protein